MRRPPERKIMLAALVLLVAAGVMMVRPAAGLADASAHDLGRLLVKKG